MNLPQQIARHLREAYFGENWTAVNLKDKLADVTWRQATRQIDSFHAIATLVCHMNYYVSAVLKVLRGGPLDANDRYSFDHSPILSQEEWDALLDTTWNHAEALANLIEQMPEDQLWEDFADGKYGNYYRNLLGIIEHHHYHLGQIALIKRLVTQSGEQAAEKET